jgi:hypothetical protein
MNSVSPSQIADAIVSGKVEPENTLDQEEVYNRVKRIQKDFKNDCNSFKRALELSIKLKKQIITDKEIDELFNNFTQQLRVSVGYIADLINPKSADNVVKKIKWVKGKMVEQHGTGDVETDSNTPVIKQVYNQNHAYRKNVEGPKHEPVIYDKNDIEEKTYLMGKEYPPKKMNYKG